MSERSVLEDRKYLRGLLREGRERGVPVVLLGSHARRTSTHTSDVDVLIVDGEWAPPPPARVQVLQMSAETLERRVAEGDDFVQWALRFGTAVTARRRWTELARDHLQAARWPSVERKLDQLRRRLRVSRDLFEMGDLDAAAEETAAALGLASRTVLLAQRVFPLSAPELAGQLRTIGEQTLATLLQEFRSSLPTDRQAVASALEFLDERVGELRARCEAGQFS